MQVTILQATENPVDLISMAAGICYGKDNVSTKRVEHCFNNGHIIAAGVFLFLVRKNIAAITAQKKIGRAARVRVPGETRPPARIHKPRRVHVLALAGIPIRHF